MDIADYNWLRAQLAKEQRQHDFVREQKRAEGTLWQLLRDMLGPVEFAYLVKGDSNLVGMDVGVTNLMVKLQE